MSSQGAVQPFKGPPLTTVSHDITPASPHSSQQSSCKSHQELLLPQAGVSRFSRLNPRIWSRKARIITLAVFALVIVALIPSLAVPLTLDAHHSSVQTNHTGTQQPEQMQPTQQPQQTQSTQQPEQAQSTQQSQQTQSTQQPQQTQSTQQPQQAQSTQQSQQTQSTQQPQQTQSTQQPQQTQSTQQPQQTQQPLPANISTTPLRIMPLGASITYGMRSTDGNGYRADLLDLLQQQGGNPDVTYVGSRNNGTMPSNAVEGWPGDRIDMLIPRARDAVPRFLPNVILVNVGTNDCVQDFDVDSTTQQSTVEPDLTSDAAYNIGSRMRVLVEDLLGWSPNVTVVVSTLINNQIPATQTRIDDANEQFRKVVREMQSQGKSSVVLAEMTSEAGGPDMNMMADETHPTDAGYALMANCWYAALVEAGQKGIIVQPQ
ncbi:hypothetical protein VMCG_07035 [Cytospora schulzeri]|uniref:SGNH hydrolase-type esterase domain-containing protein n=1 Tax=Cytospora schulzeri TaxID=448051 RepID=A0A423W415_9PEZI|nr:hypothetical protein VMCG_07035 [Valsa malicola]